MSLFFTLLSAKSAVETSAVVMDGAEDSYEPGSDPFLPSQTQFSQPFNGLFLYFCMILC